MYTNNAAHDSVSSRPFIVCMAVCLGLPVAVLAQDAARPDRARSEAAALVTGSSQHLQSVVAGHSTGAIIQLVPGSAKVGSYPPGTTIVPGDGITTGGELQATAGGFRVWIEWQVGGWSGFGLCGGSNPPGDPCEPVGSPCSADEICVQANPGVVQAQFDSMGLLDADTSDAGDSVTDDGDQPDLTHPVIYCQSDAICRTAFGENWARCEIALGLCEPSYTDRDGQHPQSYCANVGSGTCSQAACNVASSPSHYCFAVTESSRPDPGFMSYYATTVIDVPAGAKGRYVVPLVDDPTFLFADGAPPGEIPTQHELGFSIHIITGLCCYDLGSPNEACVEGVTRAECDANPAPRSFLQEQNCLNTCKMCNGNPPCLDGDPCTADACTGAGSCSYTPKAGWNPGSSCCNSSDGSIDPLGSVSPCMVPSCSQPNGRGELVLTPVAEGTPCSLQDPCFANEACDAFGNCVGDYLPGEGCWKNRFLPLLAADSGDVSALRVRLTELQNPQPLNAGCCPPPDYSAYEHGASCTDPDDCERWVGPVVDVYEHQNALNLGGHRMARLQCAPYYTNWIQEGPFYIAGAEIVPSSLYDIDQLGASCMGNEDTCLDIIASFSLATTRHGDVAAPFDPPSGGTQPDGVDVTSLVNHFRHVSGAPRKPAAQLQPNLPELNTNMNALDIVAGVDAFRGLAYAFSGPCPCPSTVVCNAMPCASAAQCGSGQTCVRTCAGGSAAGAPCLTDLHCPGGACGPGACRDRCGRCN
jgi:hypothetical protein